MKQYCAVPDDPDSEFMRIALALARRGLGTTWPNPSVGCVIVAKGRVVGRGHTSSGGRPHAEANALRMAGDAARDATAYVTLEPCSHHGRSPPCADALIAAGVARVVVAIGDPHEKVNGQGLRRLREAGIVVETGILAEAAERITAGFLMRVRHGRPLITLKLASTLDGRIATRQGESRWITGAPARWVVQALRGQHDAVMIGAGTAASDDPDLGCRIPGYGDPSSVRIVMDSHLRTRPTARLLTTARERPCWFLCRNDIPAERAQAFENLGARVLRTVPASEIGLDPAAALQALGDAGLTSVLVEGGAKLAASLLRAGLVDRLAWFHAPCVMGEDGLPAARSLDITTLNAMPRFRRVAHRSVGDDMLTEFERIDSCSPAS